MMVMGKPIAGNRMGAVAAKRDTVPANCTRGSWASSIIYFHLPNYFAVLSPWVSEQFA
jgi:hypothetical protein